MITVEHGALLTLCFGTVYGVAFYALVGWIGYTLIHHARALVSIMLNLK
jgi:hypothetical protein